MAVSDSYKEEYKDFFYRDNSLPGMNPLAYDSINRNLSMYGANVRIGPPLDCDGELTLIGVGLTVGIYMKKNDIQISLKKNLRSLDQTMMDMNKLFGTVSSGK